MRLVRFLLVASKEESRQTRSENVCGFNGIEIRTFKNMGVNFDSVK